MAGDAHGSPLSALALVSRGCLPECQNEMAPKR